MELLKPNNVVTDKAMHVMFNLKNELSMSARFLYVALMATGKDCKLKHDDLAEITDLSVMTVKKSVRELKENGLISVKRGKHGAFYEVL